MTKKSKSLRAFAPSRLRVRPKKMTKSPHWCLSQGFTQGWYAMLRWSKFLQP